MGYAYYVKMEKGILALTTDKGLFVFSVWWLIMHILPKFIHHYQHY